jgi:hypothetical protein
MNEQTCIAFEDKEVLPRGKGRSSVLITKRDRALIARYYFWTEIKRRRYDDTLAILQNQEFFISERRIENIIRESGEYLDLLLSKQAVVNDLKREYPSFNWSQNG